MERRPSPARGGGTSRFGPEEVPVFPRKQSFASPPLRMAGGLDGGRKRSPCRTVSGHDRRFPSRLRRATDTTHPPQHNDRGWIVPCVPLAQRETACMQTNEKKKTEARHHHEPPKVSVQKPQPFATLSPDTNRRLAPPHPQKPERAQSAQRMTVSGRPATLGMRRRDGPKWVPRRAAVGSQFLSAGVREGRGR